MSLGTNIEVIELKNKHETLVNNLRIDKSTEPDVRAIARNAFLAGIAWTKTHYKLEMK